MDRKILVDKRHTAETARLTNPITVSKVEPRPKGLINLPLSTANYWQQTCCWCNLAAITNCVQYHRGEWPSGGLGSTWGETAIWYLSGKGQQPSDVGYFWESTLQFVGVLN